MLQKASHQGVKFNYSYTYSCSILVMYTVQRLHDLSQKGATITEKLKLPPGASYLSIIFCCVFVKQKSITDGLLFILQTKNSSNLNILWINLMQLFSEMTVFISLCSPEIFN